MKEFVQSDAGEVNGPNPFASVTPVVVTYSSSHCVPTLAKCLASYDAVIVSDNASDDDTVALVSSLLPKAIVLKHKQNIGFGAANNRALNLVRTPYALLLNPDCSIRPEEVARLVKAAETYPEAAVIGPQIRDRNGHLEINYRWLSARWTSRGAGAEGPACVGFVSGAVMLLRMDVCAPLGFFDERFFLYYEDDDLCLKYFEAGHSLIIEPAATAVHLARQSVKRKRILSGEFWRGYHHAQSKLTYTSKHIDLVAARHLRKRLIWQTVLALPLRMIVFSPRMLARMYGRLQGVLHWANLISDQ
jgi:N-acetylglucosaminyl-diphospho-decaprenol L-rhamnosyltransferase